MLHQLHHPESQTSVVHRLPSQHLRRYLDVPVAQNALSRLAGDVYVAVIIVLGAAAAAAASSSSPSSSSHGLDAGLIRGIHDVQLRAKLAPVSRLEHPRQVYFARVSRGVGRRQLWRREHIIIAIVVARRRRLPPPHRQPRHRAAASWL